MEAVGLGCLWFARRWGAIEDDPEDYFPGDHLKDIRTALEGVDNISNIKITGRGNVVGSALLAFMDDDEDDAADFNPYPMYSSVTVSFDIFMPKRLQEKNIRLGGERCPLKTSTS